jgi:hypothetical protein
MLVQPSCRQALVVFVVAAIPANIRQFNPAPFLEIILTCVLFISLKVVSIE